MRAVFDTSPLIFLSKINYLEKTFTLFDEIFIPQKVIEEILTRDDEVNTQVNKLLESNNAKIKSTSLINLYLGLNKNLGKGESEAIALAVELNSDFIILDDSTARKQAQSLGLKVKGTLGIIRKLAEDRSIIIQDKNELYEKLLRIGFWVDKDIFDDILNI